MTSLQLLRSLSATVSEMIRDTEEKYQTLSDNELAFRADPASWSILQCYEHLNNYNRYYNSAIKNGLASGEVSEEHEIKHTWIGKKFIASMHPDNRKKQKTLRHLNPRPNLQRTVIDEFIRHQRELLGLFEVAATKDLNAIRIPVEFFKLLKMNLADTFQFVVTHQQRHFLQLARIREQLPKTGEVYLKV